MKKSGDNRDWKTPPSEITDDQVAREYSADVVVVGLGNSGTPALRAASEAGASVIGIEKMSREKYWVFGRDVGHINSAFLAGHGVPEVDHIQFFNEWMRRGGNRANPKLIMKFCRESGNAFDWFIEPFSREEIDTIRVEYWPLGKCFSGEISGQKFWAGTAQFDDKGNFAPGTVPAKQAQAKKKGVKTLFGLDAKRLEGVFSLSHAVVKNQEVAKKLGATIHYSTDAQQLVLQKNKVTGLIAKNSQGEYVRYIANKGVILAAGDFGRNRDMCRDLLPDIADLLEDREQFSSIGRDGKGIRMAVWAGGMLEARPLAAMGGNISLPMGVIATFGSLWIDGNGSRYCNEGFGDPVFTGFPGAYDKHGNRAVIFDSNIFDHLQYSAPSHMSFWVNDEISEMQLAGFMSDARSAGTEGVKIGHSILYAADTYEKLADYAGFSGDKKHSFLKTVERYNRFCLTGRDEDFGKDRRLLHTLNTPPYYIQVMDDKDRMMGNFLVTVGGLMTDEHQNVLDRQKVPIPGLYATGNCCGRRFGLQYSTPISGVSIGIAITLGREVGETVARL